MGRRPAIAVPGLLSGLLLLSSFAPASAWQEPSAAGLEFELATSRKPYLVVDLAAATISVRLLGRCLEKLPLDGFQVLRSGPVMKPPASLELPVVWRVAARPPSRRSVAAPAVLTPVAPESDSLPPPRPIPLPPDSYYFATQQGWRVELGRNRPSPGAAERWWNAVTNGWSRLSGKIRPQPDRLVLGLSPEAAAKLHHLFRSDTALLLVATDPLPPPPG